MAGIPNGIFQNDICEFGSSQPSPGPNHFSPRFFDSRGEIESDKRLVFDNQYRDLIQQRIPLKGNVAPMAGVCQQS